MQSRFKKSNRLYSVDWIRESKDLELVTQDEFKAILAELKKTRTRINTNRRSDYTTETYRLSRISNYANVYFYDGEEYRHYYTNGYDDSKNKRENPDENKGRKALDLVSKKFSELNKLSLEEAFGFCNEKEVYRCVPKQLAYYNKSFISTIDNKKYLEYVCSIDGCSQYPSNIRGDLPDWKTAVRYKGTVKPTKEYPFALYIKSGHSAQYGVYDSHDWIKSPFFSEAFGIKHTSESTILDQKPWLKEEDDETILLKKADFSLTETYEYFYSIKESYPHDSEAYKASKLVMNSSIGYMHTKVKDKSKYTNRKCRLVHLAVFALARANDKILKLANEIGKRSVIQICVDGILYEGFEPYGVEQKKMGNMHQEFMFYEGYYTGYNKFILKGEDGMKVKHGGCKCYDDGRIINDEEIKDVEDLFHWESALNFFKEVNLDE